MTDAPSPIGSTFYKSLLRCPREHAHYYEARVKPARRREALDTGIIWHAPLEVYYKRIKEWQEGRSTFDKSTWDGPDFFWGGSADAEKQAFEYIEPFMTEPGYEKTYEVVTRLLGGYFNFYRRTDRWRILAVEETVMFLVDGFEYSARLDLIVEDVSRGGMWIVEHKSAKAITEDLVSNYQMDLQILGQIWLLRHCVDLSKYPPFKGVLVNIGTKAKEPRFERIECCPSDLHLASFEESIRRWIRIRNEYALEGWPRALGNCAGFARGYTTCDFYDLCHNRPEWSLEDVKHGPLPTGYDYRDAQEPVCDPSEG